jgi:hypothetical protein
LPLAGTALFGYALANSKTEPNVQGGLTAGYVARKDPNITKPAKPDRHPLQLPELNLNSKTPESDHPPYKHFDKPGITDFVHHNSGLALELLPDWNKIRTEKAKFDLLPQGNGTYVKALINGGSPDKDLPHQLALTAGHIKDNLKYLFNPNAEHPDDKVPNVQGNVTAFLGNKPLPVPKPVATVTPLPKPRPSSKYGPSQPTAFPFPNPLPPSDPLPPIQSNLGSYISVESNEGGAGDGGTDESNFDRNFWQRKKPLVLLK